MDEKAHRLIIEELAQGHTPDQVIFMLCSQLEISWGEAEALVQEVQQEHGDVVTLKQGPVLIILGIGTLALGIGLMVDNISRLTIITNAWLNQKPIDVSVIGVSSLALYIFIGQIFIGVAMIAGSIYGLWDVWHALILWIEKQIWPET